MSLVDMAARRVLRKRVIDAVAWAGASACLWLMVHFRGGPGVAIALPIGATILAVVLLVKAVRTWASVRDGTWPPAREDTEVALRQLTGK